MFPSLQTGKEAKKSTFFKLEAVNKSSGLGGENTLKVRFYSPTEPERVRTKRGNLRYRVEEESSGAASSSGPLGVSMVRGKEEDGGR